ncbi:hypothetical protein QUF75_17225 [Desulfococcaceae bacterium HSG7]|nr:hypothetical protein [Desulfococcaceae bacterium HSG7]
MSSAHAFLDEHHDLAASLSKSGRNAFINICAAVTHLRSRKAANFFIQTFKHIQDVDKSPSRYVILKGAITLSRLNWALVGPYFEVLWAAPKDEVFMGRWTRLASDLAYLDIDVALTFLEQTPVALENQEGEDFFSWGEQALKLLASERQQLWRPLKAYLVEAAAGSCGFSLSRWNFFLDRAKRIAVLSPSAAEAFIQTGSKVCLLLNDDEIERWVSEGLADCHTDETLVNYFTGTSLKALEKRDRIATGIALKDRSNILSLLCEALLGRPVKIRSNTNLIGTKGFTGTAATDGHSIFLPDVLPDFGLFKLMAFHQAILLDHGKYWEEAGKISFNPIHSHIDADKRLIKLLPSLLEEMKAQVKNDLPASYPLKLDKKLHTPLPWWGDILPDLIKATTATIKQITEKASENYEDLPPELVETVMAAIMSEGQRDGDKLWELFKEMLDNLVLTSPDPEILQENVKTFFYKEWDANLSDYKLNWCLIRQRYAQDDPNPFVEEIRTRLHGIIRLIQRQFMRLKPERFRKYRAQPTGDGLDIDALVQAVTDMRAGAPLSENVYIRRDKRIRDVAVLFLIDMSISTEEKVNGRRVIDIQKEAMAIMAEALDALQDPYAIYGFSSDGRFRVDMFHVKDFSEPYNTQVQYRLGNLEPLDLTRMGAVIRHGIYKIDAVAAAVKLMIILTDGRPYDLEYGDLNYATADTGKALREARAKRIHPFIITSDKKGTSYLKQISPQTESVILPKVEMLPTLLPALYKRLTV